MTPGPRAIAGALIVAAVMTAPSWCVASAQTPPTLAEILARAARFVEAYAGRASGMVVEESYVQDVEPISRFGYREDLRKGELHRTLRSDLLLVRPVGIDAWMQFRDVFEVDGKAVRDRNDRLARLFLEPSKSTAAQVAKIMKESTRYNIGDVERTINLPVLGLMPLDRRAQPGFRFRLDDTQEQPGDFMAVPKTADFAIPPDAIAVAYDETEVQTMIRTPQGKNLSAKGRFWFVPATGHIVMTELRVDDWTLAAAVQVAYRLQPNSTLPLPSAMHEMYENRLNKRRIEGTATYANFREFNVAVDEKIAPAGGR
jgi:hypothetical protein